VPVTYVVFDVLQVEELNTMRLSYGERRRLLMELELEGPYYSVPEAFENGPTLFDAVGGRGLEGRGRQEALRAVPGGGVARG
jgi:bifunctional non-homologous end joining protein LigD